jgi:hypothetical protein
MIKKYTFIHPTKTGGTACEQFFMSYYSDYITGSGHENVCENNNNPIIIIRNVVDRFVSMYKYWKNGAIDTKFKRTESFIAKFNKYNIQDFISLIQNNNTEDLYYDFTWKDHFKPQSEWIKNVNYKNVIVIKHVKNLNEKINRLFYHLDIPNKGITLPIVNVSKPSEEVIILNGDNVRFIMNYFKEDFDLLNKINNSPELFRLVL